MSASVSRQRRGIGELKADEESAHPGDEDALKLRGDAYVKTGDFKKALADYTKAIELSPKSKSAYLSRGNLQAKLGNKAAAQRDLKKAADIGNTAGRAEAVVCLRSIRMQ